jgi:hypothetical protein
MRDRLVISFVPNQPISPLTITILRQQSLHDLNLLCAYIYIAPILFYCPNVPGIAARTATSFLFFSTNT